MKKEVQPEEQSVRKSQRIKSQKRANQDSQAKSAPIKTRSGDKSLQLRLKKRSEKLAKQEKQMKYSVSRQYKLARLNRSKRQRIFLMQAERRDDRWEFVVEGVQRSPRPSLSLAGSPLSRSPLESWRRTAVPAFSGLDGTVSHSGSLAGWRQPCNQQQSAHRLRARSRMVLINSSSPSRQPETTIGFWSVRSS